MLYVARHGHTDMLPEEPCQLVVRDFAFTGDQVHFKGSPKIHLDDSLSFTYSRMGEGLFIIGSSLQRRRTEIGQGPEEVPDNCPGLVRAVVESLDGKTEGGNKILFDFSGIIYQSDRLLQCVLHGFDKSIEMFAVRTWEIVDGPFIRCCQGYHPGLDR